MKPIGLIKLGSNWYNTKRNVFKALADPTKRDDRYYDGLDEFPSNEPDFDYHNLLIGWNHILDELRNSLNR